jgi:hypothetical protein
MANYKEIEKIAKKLGLVAPSKFDTNFTSPSYTEVDINHYLANNSKY